MGIFNGRKEYVLTIYGNKTDEFTDKDFGRMAGLVNQDLGYIGVEVIKHRYVFYGKTVKFNVLGGGLFGIKTQIVGKGLFKNNRYCLV